jgi:hypothetical protein
MKEILSTASNSFYRLTQKGEMQQMFEIVLVLSEPTFRVDAAGELVRDRTTESLRFVASAKSLLGAADCFRGIIADATTTVAEGKSTQLVQQENDPKSALP